MKSETIINGVMMSLFFLMFFLLYGGTHLYFFLKVKGAFSPGPLFNWGLAVFLLFMVLTPVLVRSLENRGLEAAARFVAYTGYLWMGFIFLFFTASLVVDLYRGLLHIAGFLLRRDLSPFAAGSRIAFILPLVWALSAGLYGYFEARDIGIERVVVPTPKLPPSVPKLTIVQVSDVHLGLIVRHSRLKRIIADIESASPDLLVSTGDLVDGQINRMVGLAELLQEVHPKLGKFAVIGNHEVYAGLDQAIEFTERAGFKILRNEGTAAGDWLNIAGVDDPAVYRRVSFKPPDEKSILYHLPPGRFTLLLKHQPVIDPADMGHFDLQLSGHVHKGQIFPFNLVTRLFFPLETGWTSLAKNAAIYVSRGTGTWGPPIRFMARPEVTVFELVPAENAPLQASSPSHAEAPGGPES